MSGIKITTFTEAAAGKKICPLTQPPHQGCCCGSRCMAWQWAKSVPRINCITGLLPRYAESAFDGYQEDGEHEMPDLKPAKFVQPIGAEWKFQTFEASEDGWAARWERDTDPERQGYCAALPHPLAIQQQLDLIHTTMEG